MKEFKIRRPRPQRLVIEQSLMHQMRRWMILIAEIAGTVAWYAIVLSMPYETPTGSAEGAAPPSLPNAIFWLLVLAPVLGAGRLWNDLAFVLRGGGIVFDGMSQTISRAARRLANFGDVEILEIKEFEEPEGGGSDYQLSVILKKGPAIAIARSSNYDDLVEVAVELSNLLKTKIIRPPRKNRWTAGIWDEQATETKIDLPYTSSALAQVLRWALKPTGSPYTHQDIVGWCDNFLCEYADVEVPAEVARLLPVLTEIREQWATLLDGPMPSDHIHADAPKNVHLPDERLHDWLRRIEV